jgi:Tol biopolymer transport system component
VPLAVHVISRDGGQARKVLPEQRNQLDPDWSQDGKKILFGRTPSMEPLSAGPIALQLVDLETGALSTIPGSENRIYPHWSPDKRYIAAVSTDMRGLSLFDFTTGAWKQVSDLTANYPTWTADSRSLYFDTFIGSESAIMRLDVMTARLEKVVSLKDIARTGNFGLWSGLAPDGSPLVLHDVGTQEIYALDITLP